MTHSQDNAESDATSVFPAGLIPSEMTPAADAADLAGIDPAPVGSALLVVTRGPNAGSNFILSEATVTAGRHPNSDIYLDDVSVSRRHAEFQHGPDGFTITDVGSLNGTYVNQEMIESSVLADGDEIQIGKFRLVFMLGNGADNGADSAADAAASDAVRPS